MSRLLPQTLTQNYKFSITVTDSECTPAAGYTATLALRGPATQDIDGVADGDGYEISGTVLVAGLYQYTIYAEDINQVKTLLESGRVDVEADPLLVADGSDLSTHAERVLDAIEAVIEKRASQTQQNYTINGRSLSRTPIADLLTLRDRYKDEVRQQYKRLPRNVLTTFGVR